MGRAGEHSAQVFGRAWLSPRARWRLASSGVGVAAGGRRRGGSPRLAAQTADFFLRGRTLDPAEAMQTVRLEPELEGDSPPTRELAGAGKFPRAGLHALQSLAQVSPLSCHKGKFSAGPGLTAGTLRVTPNDLGIVHEDTVYASLRQRPREFVGASAKGIALSSRAPLQLARAWNFYFSFQSLASSISTREQLLIDAETKRVAFHLAIGYGPRGNLILVVRAPLGITLVRGLEVTFGAQP